MDSKDEVEKLIETAVAAKCADLESRCTELKNDLENTCSLLASDLTKEKDTIKNELESLIPAETEEERLFEVPLAQNTFSFLIVSDPPFCGEKPNCSPFTTGVVVFCFKNAIFLILLLNLVDRSRKGNVYGIPGAVPAEVLLSQLFAFLISVLTQDDMVMSLIMWYGGFPYVEQVGKDYTRRKRQWRTAVALLFMDGSFGLFVTFLLIVQSATVLDVLLNFAAVEFVSMLDESAFTLALHGFLGRDNQACAKVIDGTKDIESDLEDTGQNSGSSESARCTRLTTKRSVGQLVVLVLVLLGWIIIAVKQSNGDYQKQALVVQFDDDTRPDLAPHSGLYFLESKRGSFFSNDKFRYVEARASDARGQFGFCRSSRHWSFFVEGDNPCRNLLMRSSETFSFDITSTTSDLWMVLDSDSTYAVPMEEFQLGPGCEVDADCGGKNHGSCKNNRCVCETDYSGLFCGYNDDEICPMLVIDRRFGNAFQASRPIGSSFYRFGKSTIYGKPVFRSNSTDDVILFTGLRWALASIANGFQKIAFEEAIEQGESFHSLEIGEVDFFSSPVGVHSSTDRLSSPLGLEWFAVAKGSNLGEAELTTNDAFVSLICSRCDDTAATCFYENSCEDGQCKCANREKGSLCELAPTGDGSCDPFFNNAKFDFDGGDCCQATCSSGTQGECGFVDISDGEVQFSNVALGFPYCRDDRIIEADCAGGKPCYIVDGVVETLGQAGAFPLLSSNGRVMLVAEPLLGVVTAFEKVGAKWTRRGNVLQEAEDTNFGYRVDVATLTGPSVFGPNVGQIPIYVAIASSQTQISVYKQQAFADSWQLFGNPFFVNFDRSARGERQVGEVKLGVFASADSDSERLTVLAHSLLDNVPHKVQIFQYRGSGGDWSRTNLGNWHLSALSGDGQKLVLYNETETTGTARFRVWTRDNPSSISLRQNDLSLSFMCHEGEKGVIQDIGLNSDGSILTVSYLAGDTVFVERIDLFVAELDELDEGDFYGRSCAKVTTTSYLASKFSRGSNAWVVVDAIGGELLSTVFSDFGSSTGWRYVGTHQAVGNEVQAFNRQRFDVSDKGFVFASDFQDSSSVNVVQSQNRCGKDELMLRISMRLDGNPQDLSWRAGIAKSIYGNFFFDDILGSCRRCYSEDPRRFRRLQVVENFCVSMALVDCLQIETRVDEREGLESGSGYASFLFNTTQNATTPVTEVSLFATGEGGTVEGGAVQLTNRPQCRVDLIECSENETLFVLALRLDGLPEETIWEIHSSSQLVHRVEYNESTVGERLVVEQVCLATNACHTFTFSDFDGIEGDGICCEYGEGEFSAFFGGLEVARSLGQYRVPKANSTETFTFGENDLYSTFTIIIGFGKFPDVIKWVIQDVSNTTSANGSNETNVVAEQDYHAYSFGVTSYMSKTESRYLLRAGCYKFFLYDDEEPCCSGEALRYKAYWDKKLIGEFVGPGEGGGLLQFGDCESA